MISSPKSEVNPVMVKIDSEKCSETSICKKLKNILGKLASSAAILWIITLVISGVCSIVGFQDVSDIAIGFSRIVGQAYGSFLKCNKALTLFVKR